MTAAAALTRRPYPDVLLEAWEAFHAPRDPGAPTVVSTFAGCGGSSCGYRMAGFRELWASEWDKHACETFRRNFPDVPMLEGDVTDLSVDQALEVAGLDVGQLDVFDGSPPCQGFSTAGRRDLTDPRSRLFEQYVRLIDGMQPRALVMENVSGMVKGKMRATFVEVVKALQQAGPGYVVGAAVLDASYLQVPSRRQRVIILGWRRDLEQVPSWPAGAGPSYTVHDAIADLEDPGPFLVPTGKGMDLARRIPPGKRGADVLVERGYADSYFGARRAAWDKPAYTITKTIRVGQASGQLHPVEHRFLGVRELSRLQSFPDAFDWGDSRVEDVVARIGNSVPPLLMRAVASHLRAQLQGLPA